MPQSVCLDTKRNACNANCNVCKKTGATPGKCVVTDNNKLVCKPVVDKKK